MNYYLSAIFSFSIALAALIGWIRFSKIGPAFYPFLLLVTLATLNELISFTLIQFRHSNAVNANIYSLLESLIILWQFKRWGLFNRNSRFFYMAIIILPLIWGFEVLFYSSITQFSSFFNIVYGLLIVLLSITLINLLLIKEKEGLARNSIFLICCGFAVFYTYSVLVEVYWVWGLEGSKSFRLNIFRILYSINLLANLTYAVAILWIPRKRKFIVLS